MSGLGSAQHKEWPGSQQLTRPCKDDVVPRDRHLPRLPYLRGEEDLGLKAERQRRKRSTRASDTCNKLRWDTRGQKLMCGHIKSPSSTKSRSSEGPRLETL
eukprot:3445198-Rhodomonas_salina.1